MIKYFKNYTRIETERLILRSPSKQDISDVVRNINNLAVSKWLLVVPYPYTRKDALWYVNHCEEKRKEKPIKGFNYGIELKQTHEVIGGISLSPIKPDQGSSSLGYWLGTSHHGQGYGSEALEALIDLAFKKLKLRRLEAGVFVGNPSSGKLLEKYGFKQEGCKRKACICKADGKIKDEYLYGLLKSEYKLPARKK